MSQAAKEFADRLIAENKPMGWLSPASGFRDVNDFGETCAYIRKARGWLDFRNEAL